MNGDHLGPSVRRATLLVRAVDAILGTHTSPAKAWSKTLVNLNAGELRACG